LLEAAANALHELNPQPEANKRFRTVSPAHCSQAVPVRLKTAHDLVQLKRAVQETKIKVADLQLRVAQNQQLNQQMQEQVRLNDQTYRMRSVIERQLLLEEPVRLSHPLLGIKTMQTMHSQRQQQQLILL
jgi:hypothetical protein